MNECGMASMPPMEQQGSPVSMNISLNASGKDHVADLINMMKNAGLQAAQPVNPEMLPMRMDMERLRGIVDGPEMEADDGPKEPKHPQARDYYQGGDDEDDEEDEIEVEGDYANEPDVQYGDMSDAIPDGDDLHKKKRSFKATAGGDNPMNTESIKAQLMAALQEKKSKPDFLDMDKDGNKKEPMKKAAKDAGKDKGSKPKKGEVPPQFKKK